VVGGSSAVLEHGTEISSKQLVMLRSDYSRITFMKYVTVAGKNKPVSRNPFAATAAVADLM